MNSSSWRYASGSLEPRPTITSTVASAGTLARHSKASRRRCFARATICSWQAKGSACRTMSPARRAPLRMASGTSFRACPALNNKSGAATTSRHPLAASRSSASAMEGPMTSRKPSSTGTPGSSDATRRATTWVSSAPTVSAVPCPTMRTPRAAPKQSGRPLEWLADVCCIHLLFLFSATMSSDRLSVSLRKRAAYASPEACRCQ